MGTDSNFDRLTRTLSSAERAELLDRVKGMGLLAEEAKGDGDAPDSPPASEMELISMGLLARFVLFVVSLLTGKPRGEVLHDMAVRRLGEEIQRTAPGLLDPRRSVFLRRTRDEIEALAAATPQFRDPLRAALGEEQDEFLAFLTGHLLPHVQSKLGATLDFSSRAADLERLETAELRRRVHEDLDAAVQSVTDEDRRGVYGEVRALHRLRGLVAIPFSEMLETFDADTVPGECAFGRLKKQLSAFDAHLHAARRPPSPAALEGLFMFFRREQIGTAGFVLEDRLTDDLGKAASALGVIHAFDRRIPLTKVVRFVTGNLEYLPRAVGGGEDWFILFKRYWSSRADGVLRGFARAKERARLTAEVEGYLGVHRLPRLGTEGVTGVAGEALRERELSIALLIGFSQEVFFKLARAFAMLLERARFVKEENRRELAQVYGFLNGLEGRLDAVMAALRSDPELAQAPDDPEVRRVLEQRAAKLLDGFLDECAASVKILSSILEGILRGSPAGRYDTVFNLDTVGEWQGRLMSEVLEEGYDRIVEGLALLGRIRAL